MTPQTPTKKINWTLIILFLLIGIIIGMVIMYSLVVYGINEILNSNSGLIQNVNINFNETKAVDRMWDYVNSSSLNQAEKEGWAIWK